MSDNASIAQQQSQAGLSASSSLRTLCVLTAAVVLGLVVWVAGNVLLLIFMGLLLATLLINLARWLQRKTSLSYGWSLALVLAAMLTVTVMVFSLFAARIAGEADQLFKTIQSTWQQLASRISEYGWASKIDGEQSVKELGNLSGDWLYRIAGVFSTTFGALSSLVLILFIGIFTAADPELYRRGVVHLIPIPRRQRWQEVLDEIATSLWWWIIGQTFSMSVVGLATGVGLWLLGIPFAGTLGLLSGLLTFIPNFGPILSAVPAILLGLTSGIMQALFVVILYLAVQAVESNLLTPLIQQRNVRLPPVLNVGVQILMGVLFGVAGLIVAAPMAIVAMVLTQRLYVEDYLGDHTLSSADSDKSDSDEQSEESSQ